jgi:hypothetical protein
MKYKYTTTPECKRDVFAPKVNMYEIVSCGKGGYMQ